MTSPDFWAILQTLAGKKDSAAMVFDILERGSAGTPPAIMADNYEAAISLLNEFATVAGRNAAAELRQGQKQKKPRTSKGGVSQSDEITRGVNAIHMISNVTARIPSLMNQSHLESSEGRCCVRYCVGVQCRLTAFKAWSAYWLPIFQALTTQCTNHSRDVRLTAFTCLQRSLQSPELTSSDHKEWTAIFGEVLFPLILRLLKPEVFSSDRDGMSEMRVQAASLLCKVFLQYLVLLSAWDGMLDLWVKIIDIMDRLMNSGQGDSLVSGEQKSSFWKERCLTLMPQEEAVRENLKNVTLFMSSSGYLVSPATDPSKEKLWMETWKRIDRFLPDLRSDLALDKPKAVEGEGETATEKQGGPSQ
jgi:golgi-specific brefeldin A-resistance guanine nucleotide exchange factor 1